MHTTSLTLLEKLRDPNDAQSWERFIALYTPFLFYWARRLKLNGRDAEDLVRVVAAALAGHECEGVVGIGLFRGRVQPRQPIQELGDGEVNLATVEMALPQHPGSRLQPASSAFSSGALSERVDAFEREVILAELKRNHSNVSQAAKSLGLERSHFYKKAEQLGIYLRALRQREQNSPPE